MKKYDVVIGKNWAGYDVPIGIKFLKENKDTIYTDEALLFDEISYYLKKITNYVKHAPLKEIYKAFVSEYRDFIEDKIQYNNEWATLNFYDIDEILHEFSGVYDKRDKVFYKKGNLSHDSMVIRLLGFDSIFEIYNHFGNKEKAIEFINNNIKSVVVINGNLDNYESSIKDNIEYMDNEKEL